MQTITKEELRQFIREAIAEQRKHLQEQNMGQSSMKYDVDEILESMVEAMLWSTTDGSEDYDEPLDNNYSAEDIHPDSMAALRDVVIKFAVEVQNQIGRDISEIAYDEGHELSDVGHDLWLTAAGHGAGFWDGDWDQYGDQLTNIAKKVAGSFEFSSPYVGDDGYIYVD